MIIQRWNITHPTFGGAGIDLLIIQNSLESHVYTWIGFMDVMNIRYIEYV